MKKLSLLLKLCFKFSRKYLKQYLIALKRPFIAGIIGFFIFLFCMVNPFIAIFGLLSIPFLCYSFWKGYLITYALIPCADNFIRENSQPFNDFVVNIKKQEGALAKFVCFIALLTIVFYLPSIIYIIKLLVSGDLMTVVTNSSKEIDNAFFINTLFLFPFLNYALCAFYYKKDTENYFKLFLNCYKKLDILGIFIALIITLFSYKLLVIYLISAIFLNPLIYSINTFWYFSRPKTDKK